MTIEEKGLMRTIDEIYSNITGIVNAIAKLREEFETHRELAITNRDSMTVLMNQRWQEFATHKNMQIDENREINRRVDDLEGCEVLDKEIDTLVDRIEMLEAKKQDAHDLQRLDKFGKEIFKLKDQVKELERRVACNSDSIGCVDSVYDEVVDIHEERIGALEEKLKISISLEKKGGLTFSEAMKCICEGKTVAKSKYHFYRADSLSFKYPRVIIFNGENEESGYWIPTLRDIKATDWRVVK